MFISEGSFVVMLFKEVYLQNVEAISYVTQFCTS
jgi:hypothetical protein